MNTELMANITYVEYTENFRVTKRLSSNSFFLLLVQMQLPFQGLRVLDRCFLVRSF